MSVPPDGYRLSREEINRLPLGAFTGEIVLVERPEEVEPALARLRGEPFLGFDTETRPSFRKGESHPLAMLQLASDRVACLFRVHRIGLPPPLQQVLSRRSPVKIGQGVADELKRLQAELGTEGRGFVDLQPIARKLNVVPHSVRGLAAHFLGLRVSKSSQISNWERERLSPGQLRYAATDAWVCRQVYLELQARGLLPRDLPSNPDR